MNKFGIKVYGDRVYKIDGIDSSVNSIKHHNSPISTYKFRIIKSKDFGIRLLINRFL